MLEKFRSMFPNQVQDMELLCEVVTGNTKVQLRLGKS